MKKSPLNLETCPSPDRVQVASVGRSEDKVLMVRPSKYSVFTIH